MSKHNRPHPPSPTSRRARFAEPVHRARRGTPLFVIAGASLLFLGILAIVIVRSSTPATPDAQDVTTRPGGDVTLDAATFEDGQARFYRYAAASGRDVRFFVTKSADGVIRAAFDSCDVCYRERKGYRQVGGVMVCNNCGQSFPSDRINELRGGCNPAPIERTVVDGHVVLRAAALEQGAFYF